MWRTCPERAVALRGLVLEVEYLLSDLEIGARKCHQGKGEIEVVHFGARALALAHCYLESVKNNAASKKVKVRPVLVDDLPLGALPTPAELKKLHKLADRAAAGKTKIRYLDA